MKGYKKCKVCSNLFERDPFKPFIQFCSYECAIEILNRKTLKQLKEDNPKMPKLKKLARDEFQKYIRLRDADLPCISCGKVNTKKWDGGHFQKAEIYSGLIFDPDNCHKQCVYCNRDLDGNLIEYRKGLVNRYGEQFVKDLEGRADASRVYKYTKEELISIKQHYKQLNNESKTD